jgi:hypothetical protein
MFSTPFFLFTPIRGSSFCSHAPLADLLLFRVALLDHLAGGHGPGIHFL